MEHFGYDYKKEKVIFYNKMAKEACLKLYHIAEENQVKFVMNTVKGRIVTKLDDNMDDQLLEEPIEEFLEKTEVMQCLLQDSNFETIKELKSVVEKIEGIGIKNQSKSLSNPKVKPTETTYCDIADELTSKGYGVKRFCEELKINTNNVITIGDDYNDVSMFGVSGYSVAMGNANEEVKALAKEVTATNNKEGVAIFLEKLAQNKGEILC